MGSQEELLQLLALKQCNITQATLSRDLKTLHTSKIATENGGYRYVLGNSGIPPSDLGPAAEDSDHHSAVLSVARTGHTVVIQTRNGYAGGVSFALDEMHHPLILGTIAGINTVFVATAEEASRMEIYEILCRIIPSRIMQKALPSFKE